MQAFELTDLIATQKEGDHPYLEFLRFASMSMGLYVLPVGGVDRQQPHGEDEVYYVVNGQAVITVGDEQRPVKPGSIVYVAAKVPHHFHDITEELKVLVFFAPAEGSHRDH